MKDQKIYLGRNKREAKEISLKDLIFLALKKDLESETIKVEQGEACDKSDSWIDIDRFNSTNTEVISALFKFDPLDDNNLVDFEVWCTPVVTIVESSKMKKLT